MYVLDWVNGTLKLHSAGVDRDEIEPAGTILDPAHVLRNAERTSHTKFKVNCLRIKPVEGDKECYKGCYVIRILNIPGTFRRPALQGL